jgi:hypothetical protein
VGKGKGREGKGRERNGREGGWAINLVLGVTTQRARRLSDIYYIFSLFFSVFFQCLAMKIEAKS